MEKKLYFENLKHTIKLIKKKINLQNKNFNITITKSSDLNLINL